MRDKNEKNISVNQLFQNDWKVTCSNSFTYAWDHLHLFASTYGWLFLMFVSIAIDWVVTLALVWLCWYWFWFWWWRDVMFEHSPPSLLAVDQVKRRLDKTNQPTNKQKSNK